MNEDNNVISILNSKKLKPVVTYLTQFSDMTIDELHDQLPIETFQRILKTKSVDEYRQQIVGE